MYKARCSSGNPVPQRKLHLLLQVRVRNVKEEEEMQQRRTISQRDHHREEQQRRQREQLVAVRVGVGCLAWQCCPQLHLQRRLW